MTALEPLLPMSQPQQQQQQEAPTQLQLQHQQLRDLHILANQPTATSGMLLSASIPDLEASVMDKF